MDLVLQKPKSFNCGQCCVAMLAGLTRKQANKVFGTKGGTTTKMVQRALKKLGYQAGEQLRSFRSESALPALCMLKLTFPRQVQVSGHWVVYYNGLVYCPSLGIYPFDVANTHGNGLGKFTSYLTVTKR